MNTLCPVCHQPVDPAMAPTSLHEGTRYYLRCPHCKERFDADPERYLTGSGGECEGACEEHQHVITLGGCTHEDLRADCQ